MVWFELILLKKRVLKLFAYFLILGLAYSEHSSFEELSKFIRHFKPKKIIPTVNVASKEKRDQMNDYFNKWLAS
jgi:Cft2 family RNA processing exonuclease